MKIIIISIAIILIVPLCAGAEVIYLKDGTTVKAAKVWEEDGFIRFNLKDYDDITITYSKEIVERIEKGDGKAKAGLPKTEPRKKDPTPQKQIGVSETGNTKQTAKVPKNSLPLKKPDKESKPAAVKHSSTAAGARQKPVPPEKQDKSRAPAASKQTVLLTKPPKPVVPEALGTEHSPPDGVLFYNPRRTYKYWSGPGMKHRTLNEAIAALADKFNRSPEWVAKNLGDTNDLGEIYRNLGRTPAKTAAATTSMVETKGALFYNPRRPYKYHVSEKLRYHTLDEAAGVLAEQYNRSPQWIKDHLGESNDIGDIHNNLTRAKAAEPGRD